MRIARVLSAAAALLVAVAAPALAAPAAPAAARVALDLPLYDPAAGQTRVPAYEARRLELRLAPAARPADAGRALRTGRAGTAVDPLLSRVGAVSLVPEFPGATPPAPGSREPDLTGYYLVTLAPGADLPAALAACRSARAVETADPIGVFPVQAVPSDSLFPYQYGFSQLNDRDSDLPEAWDLTTGDSTVSVAILDTGVLWTHPDLGGPAPYTSGNLWHNWAEMAGEPGVDDDHNGFIDDFIGWDFVDGKTGRAGEDLQTADNDPSDFVGHGTFVAGVAAAITDNGSGVAGAGYRVRLMSLRVGWDDALGPGGVVDMAYCAQAIYYASRMGATAINCSWNNGDLGGLGAAVSYAIARGATVVVAAGNQGSSEPLVNYLATRGDCVVVASLDADDRLTYFSNYGPWVDVAAAGLGIRSTSSVHYAPGYGIEDGTSFSAPLVTGIVGLYQSWRKAHGLAPASPAEVRARLHDTADPVDAMNPGYEGDLGGGRVNALRMITDPPTSFSVWARAIMRTAPAFADWGGVAQAMVVGTDAGLVQALDSRDGSTLAGWPVDVGSPVATSPALWDVDFDGRPEALVGTDDGKLWALRADGTPAAGWPATLAGAVTGGPALADVTGDPAYEVVAVTAGPGSVCVLTRLGAPAPGWPLALPADVNAAPALADLDGDGKAEVIFGAADSLVRVLRGDGTALAGWPVRVGGAVATAPAVGDLDGDGVRDVVIGADDGLVYAWSAGGTPLPGWPRAAGAAVRCGPALADVDGDQRLEVIAGTVAGTLHVWRDTGAELAGWPVETAAALAGSPDVADIDHDGAAEILVGGADRSVHAYRVDGAPALGWPRTTGGELAGAGSLGDPDRDGRLELVVGSFDNRLYCWDLGLGTYDAARLPWFTAGRSFLRQGFVTAPSIGVGPLAGPTPARLSLTPNPSLGASAVRFAAGGPAGREVSFRVVSPAGRLVRAGTVRLDTGGAAAWALDGGGASRLPAGIYFVEARAGAAVARAKWVLLR